jgi:hypothetical protein
VDVRVAGRPAEKCVGVVAKSPIILEFRELPAGRAPRERPRGGPFDPSAAAARIVNVRRAQPWSVIRTWGRRIWKMPP